MMDFLSEEETDNRTLKRVMPRIELPGEKIVAKDGWRYKEKRHRDTMRAVHEEPLPCTGRRIAARGVNNRVFRVQKSKWERS